MPSMTSLADYFGALAALREAGLIRHLGVSGVTPEQLAEAQAVAPVVCVQNRYFLGASAAEHGFADACGEQGVAFVPFFSIAGTGRGAGVSGSEHAGRARDRPGARRHRRAGPAGLDTAARPAHAGIPGTGDPGHLAANVAATRSAHRRYRGSPPHVAARTRGDNRLTGLVAAAAAHARRRP